MGCEDQAILVRSFQNQPTKKNLDYKCFCALYEWQENLEPKLKKIAKQCGIKIKMVGTIKVIVTQQYWEDPYQYWASYGFRPLF
ncbi:hypothetical protein LQW54_003508 [Pestalotiopsis sp. IQ-011]